MASPHRSSRSSSSRNETSPSSTTTQDANLTHPHCPADENSQWRPTNSPRSSSFGPPRLDPSIGAHHTNQPPRLNDSRAQNILWLLEELNLSYTTEVFLRQPNRLAPPELTQVHPLGKSPVLEITPPNGGEPIKLAESGYITQYLVDHFGQNKPSLVPRKWKDGQEGKVGGETEAYARFQYLLHYVEGTFFPTLVQYLLFSSMPFPPSFIICSYCACLANIA